MLRRYPRVAATLSSLDPFRWPLVRDRVPTGTSRLDRRVGQLASLAREKRATRPLGELPHRLASVDPSRTYGLVPDLPPLAGRHPVVLAHGPSLRTLLPGLAAHRDRLYVIAPLRTALRLADAGLRPDVIVLADAASVAYDLSQQAWDAAPAATRHSLADQVALVTEPLAPPAIAGRFARVLLFDDGSASLPLGARLPFWGSALVPSVCLPIVLGGTTVAVGGLDFGAATGPLRRTWRGAPQCLDTALEVVHGVLECLAQALPDTFVDLTPDSIAKRGFVPSTIPQWLERPVPDDAPIAAGGTVRGIDLLSDFSGRAEAFARAASAIASAGSRMCTLAGEPVSAPLATLVHRAEHDWPDDPCARAALGLIQIPYLQSLWDLRDLRVTPRNRDAATVMKARLVGPEIAALSPTLERWMADVRGAARAAA